MTSGGILQEVRAFREGHSHDINECIRHVKALERDLDVCFYKLLQCLTYLIGCADQPCKNSEEPLSVVEVTAVLNVYQKLYNLSFSHFIDTLSLLCLRFPSPVVSCSCICGKARTFYSRFFSVEYLNVLNVLVFKIQLQLENKNRESN